MKHRVVSYVVVLSSVIISLSAFAEACWDEGTYKGQKILRNQCVENVSVSKTEFPVAFCTPKLSGDSNQKEAKCPVTPKLKVGVQVASQPVAARCEGVHLENINGKVRFMYYADSDFYDNRETLRDMCFLKNGKWHEGAS